MRIVVLGLIGTAAPLVAGWFMFVWKRSADGAFQEAARRGQIEAEAEFRAITDLGDGPKDPTVH